jgi:branched-chain amino acid transport system permease protein
MITLRRGLQPGWPLTAAASIAAIACCILVPRVASQGLMSLLDIMCIYAVVSYSVAFLFGFGGQMSVAHAALFGVGAYVTGYIITHYHIPLAVTTVLSGLGGGAAALIVGGLSMRLKGHYFVITTFAFVEVASILFTNLVRFTGGGEGTVIQSSEVPFNFIKTGDLTTWFYVLVALLIIVIAACFALARSPFGHRLQAVRDNEDLATALGIRVARTKIVAFVLSGCVAGIAGSAFALFYLYIQPESFSPSTSITFVQIVILGGATAVLGPLVGAILVVVLPGVINLSPILSQVCLGVLFILFILIAPEGIAGRVTLLWADRKPRAETEVLGTAAAAVACPPSDATRGDQ